MSRLDTKDDVGSARSADRALRLLEFLSKRIHVTPTMIIGAGCDIPKSTLHNLLNLMRDRRFVTYHRPERGWTLGPRLAELCVDSPSLVQALAVFRAFEQGRNRLSVAEIARRSRLSSEAVARALRLLEKDGLVRRGPDERYGLGLRFVSLASRVGDLDRLRMAAQRYLVELRGATGETANLVVRDGDHALEIDQVESRQALRHTGWFGVQIPLTNSAAGAALCGAMGVQVVHDAVEEGVTAVACSILGTDDPPAALSVTGPTFRLQAERLKRTCEAVQYAAMQVGAALHD
jgi:DNA-binding IclR family transcriptional regulator